ncbi:TonB-dependent siderophore receptor [Aliifodinibius salipaludis]|uniref:TonB-dependent siderophore receptor n=1 Tax=Fodinibius salipaludis TaxID=2032627 RepID=A0A2A2GC61_9BACT|nr:TonB-dependent receptor [Aliifodinibius salipaludis]PAU94449.1 TonB-dependent siderophore receptor [Aliifodinibius salipaludis]
MNYQNNFIRATLTALLFFIFSASVFAQSAKIEGQVTNTEQKPVPNINIALQGTSFGDASDSQGYYSITEIPAGDYTLVVSAVGYTTQRKSISIESEEELSVNITLSDKNEELQEIVVEGNQINKFSTEFSGYVAKLPVQDLENPQVYNTISADLIEEQALTSFEDILKNAPGVFKLWESTGRGGDGAGYYAIRGFSIQPQMMNGLPSLTNGSLDPANIERVELMKGPSATLFGTSVTSYGGLINVVTKKPYDTFGGQVSYKAGSFGLNRVTADINMPISSEENIALRINSAYHKENSFQDAGFSESLFLAPSLSYEVNEDLSFLINTELYHSESTNPLMLFLNRGAPLEANNPSELGYNNELSYTTNDLTINNPAYSLQGKMTYNLSENWTSETVLSRSSAKSDGYYSYVSTIGFPENIYSRRISDQNSTTNGTDIQQNFKGDFELAGLRNRMVIGLDFFQEKVINNSTGYTLYDTINLTNNNPTPISKAKVDTMLASSPVNKSKTEQKVYSAYVSDVIDVLPQVSAMLSLRLDHFVNEGNVRTENDDYDQTTLSPKFGLVYQPFNEQLSIFGNYMNSFNNVAPKEQGDGTIESFSPERANQWEAGVKTNLFNGRLNATASYYDITVSDVVRSDPNRANYSIQDGELYSRGFELSLNAAPINGLNITAGYSHNESEYTVTSTAGEEGRRPNDAGPSDLINGWISYELTSGPLAGAGLGLGGNYASDNYVTNNSQIGRFTIPAYTVLNTSVFYNTDNYRLTLKVNNFTDEEYYNGWSTVNPQRPRNITAGFTYKF